ncbi:MAG: tetratricopeptide repeat protein, partial [Anaerolineae bacterium]
PSPTMIVLRFVIAMISTLGFVWLIIELVGWIFGWKLLANTGLLGGIVVGLMCAFASAVYVLIYLYKQTVELQAYMLEGMPIEELPEEQQNKLTFRPRRGKPLTENLLEDLQEAYQMERWEEVIKIGSVLSQPLWVTGKYGLRVELGRLIESAAAYSHNPRQQARALIDDLGWTLFVLGEVDEAKKNIWHGIKLAEECNDFYLAHKGYRHLCGIAMESNDLDKAIAHLTKAQEYVQRIEEGASKLDVAAGLHVATALLRIKQHNWEDALREIEAAQTMYRKLDDKDHEVSLYHLQGDVLFEIGRVSAAKDVYRRGLSGCKRESQKDGILKNYIGIATVAMLESDVVEASKAYLRAAETARELGRETLARELEATALKRPRLI